MRAGRQLAEVGHHAVVELVRVAARQPDDEVGLRVVLPVEIAHVVERQLLQRGERADVVMPVGVSGVDDVIESFFAEFLVVALAQGDFEEVDGVGFEAREIVGAKAGVRASG